MGVMFTNPDCLEPVDFQPAQLDLSDWPTIDPDMAANFAATNITTRQALISIGLPVVKIHVARNRPVEWPVGSNHYYRVID